MIHARRRGMRYLIDIHFRISAAAPPGNKYPSLTDETPSYHYRTFCNAKCTSPPWGGRKGETGLAVLSRLNSKNGLEVRKAHARKKPPKSGRHKDRETWQTTTESPARAIFHGRLCQKTGNTPKNAPDPQTFRGRHITHKTRHDHPFNRPNPKGVTPHQNSNLPLKIVEQTVDPQKRTTKFTARPHKSRSIPKTTGVMTEKDRTAQKTMPTIPRKPDNHGVTRGMPRKWTKPHPKNLGNSKRPKTRLKTKSRLTDNKSTNVSDALCLKPPNCKTG